MQADRDWDQVRSPSSPVAVEVVKALAVAEERMRTLAADLARLRRQVGALAATSEPAPTVAPAGREAERLPLARPGRVGGADAAFGRR